MKNKGNEVLIASGRKFMQSNFNDILGDTDQEKLLARPPISKNPLTTKSVKLPKKFEGVIKQASYEVLFNQRRSHRTFTGEALTMQQLSFILYSTQGVQKQQCLSGTTRRTVPSGGARHPFETYITVQNVQGLQVGLYHYLAEEHAIEFVREMPNYADEVSVAMNGQTFTVLSPILLIWACVPYRSEWRYSIAAHRIMLLDAGHIGQNAYLSAEAMGLGACAIAAFNQEESDKMLGVDGVEEFTVYAAPIGAYSNIFKK